MSIDGGMSKAVIVQNQDRPSGARLRLKKNASDHPAAVEDDVIVFVSNPKMLSLTYRAQSVERKLVPGMIQTFSGAKTAVTFIQLNDDRAIAKVVPKGRCM